MELGSFGILDAALLITAEPEMWRCQNPHPSPNVHQVSVTQHRADPEFHSFIDKQVAVPLSNSFYLF